VGGGGGEKIRVEGPGGQERGCENFAGFHRPAQTLERERSKRVKRRAG